MSTALSLLDDYSNAIETKRVAIEKVLPKHLTVDRFVQQVRNAFVRNSGLLKCDKFSVIDSVMQLAELGLDPSGALGSGYLVPFAGKCTPVPGYRGLIDLAVRSGEVKGIKAEPCFWGPDGHDEWSDEWDHMEGDRPRLHHKPWYPKSRADQEELLKLGESYQRPVRAAYAIAILPSRERQFRVMYFPELERTRLRSPGGRSAKTPWFTDRVAMYVKTPIRALCKQLALSPTKAAQLNRALELDDEFAKKYEGQEANEDTEDAAPPAKRSAAERLKKDLGAKPSPAEPSEAEWHPVEPPDDVKLPTRDDQPKKGGS